MGFVPNLYATFAHSKTALGNYLSLQNGESSLSLKAREVINHLVVRPATYLSDAEVAWSKPMWSQVPAALSPATLWNVCVRFRARR